jgi:hypothetical protein
VVVLLLVLVLLLPVVVGGGVQEGAGGGAGRVSSERWGEEKGLGCFWVVGGWVEGRGLRK